MAGPAPRCPSVLSSPGSWQQCLLMLRSPPGGFAICLSSKSTRSSSIFGQESRSSALLAFPETVLFTFPSHLVHLRSEVWIYVARPRCPLRQHLRFTTCKAHVWRGSRALHSNSCRLKHYLQEQWCWLSRMGAPFDPGEAALNATAHCPRMREEHQWCYCSQQPPSTMFRWRGMT